MRVGIIGANPERGWASRTHLPAAATSEHVELVAVATTRVASAQAAAERFGARRAYADPYALIADPDVDAVTVAVKVPEHFALVTAALEAGKHVYCEWPLGADTDEAVALRDLAAARGVRTVVGLQSARSVQVRRVRELIEQGGIGRLVSATLRCAAGLGGPRIAAADAWRADDVNGVSPLTVTAGHALDTLLALTGELATLSATVATRFPQAVVEETGELLSVAAPDQIAVTGTTAEGVVVAAHIQGGVTVRPGTWIELRGETGLLELAAVPSLSASALVLREDDAEHDGPVDCVRRLYADLAAARGPDFEHAVRRHRLLDAIRASSTAESLRG